MTNKQRGFYLKKKTKKLEYMTDILKDMLETQTKEIDGKTYSLKEAVAKTLIDMALSGDKQAIKEIIDRMDGKLSYYTIKKMDGNIDTDNRW